MSAIGAVPHHHHHHHWWFADLELSELRMVEIASIVTIVTTVVQKLHFSCAGIFSVLYQLLETPSTTVQRRICK